MAVPPSLPAQQQSGALYRFHVETDVVLVRWPEGLTSQLQATYLGKAIRAMVESWPSDQRVAIRSSDCARP